MPDVKVNASRGKFTSGGIGTPPMNTLSASHGGRPSAWGEPGSVAPAATKRASPINRHRSVDADGRVRLPFEWAQRCRSRFVKYRGRYDPTRAWATWRVLCFL